MTKEQFRKKRKGQGDWRGKADRARPFLFERIECVFGSPDTWQRSSYPSRELKDAYNKFCDAFAIIVGAPDGRAVKLQIRFAVVKNGKFDSDGHAQNAILCKAAALGTGFIENKHLPDFVATKPKKKVKL